MTSPLLEPNDVHVLADLVWRAIAFHKSLARRAQRGGVDDVKGRMGALREHALILAALIAEELGAPSVVPMPASWDGIDPALASRFRALAESAASNWKDGR